MRDTISNRDPIQRPTPATGPLFQTASDPSSSLVHLETAVIDAAPSDEGASTPTPAASRSAAPVHHLDGRYSMHQASEVEVMFRHRHWSDRRTHLARIIEEHGYMKSRMERWTACGAEANVFWDQPAKRLIVSCIHCHDRFCWPCATARSKQIARNLHDHLQKLQTRFLTLTLRSNTKPLSDQVTRLYTCFRALRADPWWKQHVDGSAAFCEITLDPNTLLWHPHLHPVTSGKFMPQEVLSRKWLGVTGDSPIVHIKAVPKPSAVANYVCKYASKPMDASVFVDDDKLRELVTSLVGRRLCLTTGGWQKLKLTAKPKALDYSTLQHLGSLNRIATAARDGSKKAQYILTNLQRGCTWESINAPSDEVDENGEFNVF